MCNELVSVGGQLAYNAESNLQPFDLVSRLKVGVLYKLFLVAFQGGFNQRLTAILLLAKKITAPYRRCARAMHDRINVSSRHSKGIQSLL